MGQQPSLASHGSGLRRGLSTCAATWTAPPSSALPPRLASPRVSSCRRRCRLCCTRFACSACAARPAAVAAAATAAAPASATITRQAATATPVGRSAGSGCRGKWYGAPHTPQLCGVGLCCRQTARQLACTCAIDPRQRQGVSSGSVAYSAAPWQMRQTGASAGAAWLSAPPATSIKHIGPAGEGEGREQGASG